MIRFSDFVLARAGRPLFEAAQLAIHPGERIALIGPNGSGKSSLLAALRGELHPEQGSLDMPGWRVAWLAQELASSPDPVIDYVLQADAAVADAARAILEAERSGDGERIAHAYEVWTDVDGASARSRASTLLAGLGFSEERMAAPVDALSGGWRVRLNLARVLMAPADLLLLDEPTNHLDLDAVLWLERLLIRLPATQIIVSHDRDFLDRVATASLAIDDNQLLRFSGGYTASENIRAEQARQRARQIEANQQRIAHLSQFVARFRAQATKARQAQSRLKALERIEVLAPLRAARGIDFEFAEPPQGPDPLLRAEHLHTGYGADTEHPVLVCKATNLTIRRGARIGILGRNGAGKTTLIRTLTGDLGPLAGTLTRASTLRPGYLAQQQIEQLDPLDAPLDHMRRLAPDERDPVLRSFLGQFGFSGENALRPIGPMSGGEKTRLCLAALVWGKPGFLILDEPTNHLDAATRDALADALAGYEGALILVSHDRYLLRATVDEFMLIDDGNLIPFDGDLDDYASWLAKRGQGAQTPPTAGLEPSAAASATAPANTAEQRKERARLRAERQRLAQPHLQRQKRLDTLMERLTARTREIDSALQAPDTYDQPDRAADLARERATIASELSGIEEEWLELESQIETLRAEPA